MIAPRRAPGAILSVAKLPHSVRRCTPLPRAGRLSWEGRGGSGGPAAGPGYPQPRVTGGRMRESPQREPSSGPAEGARTREGRARVRRCFVFWYKNQRIAGNPKFLRHPGGQRCPHPAGGCCGGGGGGGTSRWHRGLRESRRAVRGRRVSGGAAPLHPQYGSYYYFLLLLFFSAMRAALRRGMEAESPGGRRGERFPPLRLTQRGAGRRWRGRRQRGGEGKGRSVAALRASPTLRPGANSSPQWRRAPAALSGRAHCLRRGQWERAAAARAANGSGAGQRARRPRLYKRGRGAA